jgi:hypothetical protein
MAVAATDRRPAENGGRSSGMTAHPRRTAGSGGSSSGESPSKRLAQGGATRRAETGAPERPRRRPKKATGRERPTATTRFDRMHAADGAPTGFGGRLCDSDPCDQDRRSPPSAPLSRIPMLRAEEDGSASCGAHRPPPGPQRGPESPDGGSSPESGPPTRTGVRRWWLISRLRSFHEDRSPPMAVHPPTPVPKRGPESPDTVRFISRPPRRRVPTGATAVGVAARGGAVTRGDLMQGECARGGPPRGPRPRRQRRDVDGDADPSRSAKNSPIPVQPKGSPA